MAMKAPIVMNNFLVVHKWRR